MITPTRLIFQVSIMCLLLLILLIFLLFDMDSDSRTNLLEEGGTDVSRTWDYQAGPDRDIRSPRCELSMPEGPMTRARAKRLKETLYSHVGQHIERMELAKPIGGELVGSEPKLIHLSQILGTDDLGT